ncbi:MAG: SRPBCC family protein [Cytophagales bacterium]|nr:SRPBCC family protein [Cytophagales bacterium]
MSIFTLRSEQRIPAELPQVWAFISSPKNLKTITPDYMGFHIIGPEAPERMYEGLMIQYKVSPMFGIGLNWLTEITHVREGEYFVDEQRLGPYRMWHHQHHLRSILGGVLMRDEIHYIPPLGWLGDIANALFIRRQLDEIFTYRHHKLVEIFGAFSEE